VSCSQAADRTLAYAAGLRPDGSTAWARALEGPAGLANVVVDRCATELLVAGKLYGGSLTFQAAGDAGSIVLEGGAGMAIVRLAP
jgi:hypothetical protein